MLVQYYLCRLNRELGREIREVTPEGLERLRAYPWPGNIRELQSVLKQALLKASGPVLLAAFLPEPLGGTSKVVPLLAAVEDPAVETFILRQRIAPDVRDIYSDAHRQLDRLLLARVLEHTRGNLQQAALLLGIARQTLRLKLRDLGLSVSRSGELEEDDVE
jgi:two-component system nitrogen regulation response regulator GlnG